MYSNAPAQLLGYTLQFPRALYHLLKSGPGDSVSIEVLGDVVTHKLDNTIIAEEDKSSTKGNPLTDRSTDLWKTFYNWINAINNGILNIEKTHFILYCNQSGRKSYINKFDTASCMDDAIIIVDEVKKSLNDITSTHEIWNFYNYVINENRQTLIELIPRFELQIDGGLGYKEINYELQRIHVPESQLEFLSNHLNGWLQKEIMIKISLGKHANVSWDEFNHQYLVLFDRARRLELIDFALQSPPQESMIQQQVKSRPYYLKQLEQIEADDDEIIEAVSDYIRAKVNRDKWIEKEIIDEEIAADFESRLCRFWENRRKSLELTEKIRKESERGKLLYLDCCSRQETIRDVTPPYSTISGTYHLLANGNILGWHPQWILSKPDK